LVKENIVAVWIDDLKWIIRVECFCQASSYDEGTTPKKVKKKKPKQLKHE